MSSLRVASLKVRGVRPAVRRAALFLYANDLAFDVCFVQEAHIGGDPDVAALKEQWERGPSMWGGGNVKADGVGTVFRGADFVVDAEWKVVAGRVLCVDIGWRGSFSASH